MVQALTTCFHRRRLLVHRLLSRLSPIAGFGNATVQGLNYISERWLPRFFPEGEKGTVSVRVICSPTVSHSSSESSLVIFTTVQS